MSRRYHRHSIFDMDMPFWLFMTLVAIAFTVVSCVPSAAVQAWSNNQTRVCTVEDKDRAARGNGGSSDMRVYTAECGVLRVQDLATRWQWNSADIYASIEVGKTYKFHTVGYRIPVFSAFPNVLGFPKEVS